ncbi:midasin-like isoform X2 [Halichondria panicea]|uniref:midasin-like isoform X2 n=1 Tax=Halichondria panicea TaxID=6063 RepID=UPI00312BC815
MEDKVETLSDLELIISCSGQKQQHERERRLILTKDDVNEFPECVQQLLCDLSVVVESADSCVVLEGPSGCGKTTLIQALAQLQQHELMVVHLGEQIDSKVLLGTFTSTSYPGEFVWKPGPLTKAVESGLWLLMEDIDLATPDVLGLLLPLIKTRELMIPGYTRPIIAAPGFKLLLTQRTFRDGSPLLSSSFALLHLLSQHSTIFKVSPISSISVGQILAAKHPDLSQFIVTLLSAVEGMNVHIRQLLKVCDRVSPQVYNGRITSVEDFMLEVIDCLCGSLSLPDKEVLAVQFGSLVGGISKEKIEQLCRSHRPSVQRSPTTLSVGRANIIRLTPFNPELCFAHTSSSLRLLESVCRCVQMNEPVLLVGETGVGKTAVVNYLSKVTDNRLVVFNMSEQTESTDLLGGFKPLQLSHLLDPVKAEFETLFHATFSLKQNGPFLSSLQETYSKQNWKKLLKLMSHSVESALSSGGSFISEWKKMAKTLGKFQKQLASSRSTFAFDFVEGALVEAVRSGSWILLDEVNLASSETLQCLSGLLECANGSFLLPEKLEAGVVKRHPNFRLFCCMNPATDFGKKSLPYSVRNRLTEFYVDEVQDSSDLRLLVHTYLQSVSPPSKLVEGIIKLHLSMKKLAESRLQDGTGRKPNYSLRNLCRALTYCRQMFCGSLLRSAYEGFCMSFLSEVRGDYHPLIMSLISHTLSVSKTCISAPIPPPNTRGYIQVEGFWLYKGSMQASVPEEYVLTESVRKNIKNMARVVSARSLPVLLQGPTSAGKTSMVQYLARTLGHKCVRINNHEHTDLQEYVGMYTANSQGQLVFQEGVLVDAMRHGYWIILDELNLAPTEVLEALNRVLDDNRELFIPETQELVQAHPNFLLFGTQNPPGIYAGRKVLSRAFRNRFIELHIEDIPPDELVTILHQRCSLPTSYAKKMVDVMKELQMVRSESGIFHGKHGLITLRDLFRWAERYRRSKVTNKFYDWEQQLAEDGYMLLGGRLRTVDEQTTILEVVQKHFKRTVDRLKLFGLDEGCGSLASAETLALLHSTLPEDFQHLVWTDELQSMAVLVHRALCFDEPVLMVGATGCGKTSLCQLLSALLGRQLFSVNCHLHTDASDFLGGLRPVRSKHTEERESGNPGLFQWSDGVVIQAMRSGGCLMIDEISLAGDAVLERLNSILEPERKLLVSERTRYEGEVYEISASRGFAVLATMNPGGDYGKKELSPALRNRMVEIWCPVADSRKSYQLIVKHNLLSHFLNDAVPWSDLICEVVEHLRDFSRVAVSVRDLLTWVTFMNKTSGYLSPPQGFYHGAHLVFVDALGCGSSLGAADLKKDALDYLLSILQQWSCVLSEVDCTKVVTSDDKLFGVSPFYIEIGAETSSPLCDYSLSAPGPSENLFRLLRAMQLGKPLLLEGPPGVGKTSLVTSLATASGHRIVRINLSEQTDISDLFGTDLPVEGGESVQFAWRDGPFLKALRRGDWIVLDEMNLASQSVLEGLNACLDHRGEVFIPELGMHFVVKKSSRIFACQNPLHQGGGRKGLPKSFTNRFTQVYIDKLSPSDLLHICTQVFPEFSREMLERMITFTFEVDSLVKSDSGYKLWEFNLRDVLRWCALMKRHKVQDPSLYVRMLYSSRLRRTELQEKVHQLYLDVFEVTEGSEHKFPAALGQYFHVSSDTIQVGCALLRKQNFHSVDNESDSIAPLHCQMQPLEVLAHCVDMGWMAIIVGKCCTGKSSIVRSLARMCGHKLLELPVTSVTDTTDLLGGFEQVNLRRHCVNLASLTLDTTECLLSSANNNCELLQQPTVDTLKTIANELRHNFSPAVCDVSGDKQVLLSQCKKLKLLVKTIQRLTKSTDVCLLHDMSDVLFNLESLRKKISGSESSGQFEWVDSVLVEAVKYGHWLLISHANFCSPSVLDRLNALLEPGGVLCLDEKGMIGDSEPLIQPHSDFRLFLTMDPCHGEISRAMRNRGIEVYIHSEESLLNSAKFSEDLKTLLHLKTSLHPGSSTLSRLPTCVMKPQQMISLVRCSLLLNEGDCTDIDGYFFVEARRILGFSELDTTAELNAVSICRPSSYTSSWLFSQHIRCISNRDFSVLLSTCLEDSTTVAVNAALEVFVCSSSSAEACYRVQLLQTLSKVLWNSAYHSIVLAWMKVLNRAVSTRPSSPTTLFNGIKILHLYPTSNPLLSLMEKDLDLPLAMLPVSAELIVLKASVENHNKEASNMSSRSILQLSRGVYYGSLIKESLPHASLMYLQPFVEQVLIVVSDLWLNDENLVTAEQLLTVHNFTDWLAVLFVMCSTPQSSLPDLISSWALFRSEGLSLMMPQLESHCNWKTLSTLLENLKPLEDCIKGSKIYSVCRTNLFGVAVGHSSIPGNVMQEDCEIRASSSPTEVFAMHPPVVAELRLNNIQGSDMKFKYRGIVARNNNKVAGRFIPLKPVLMFLKSLIVKLMQKLQVSRDDVFACLKYCLRLDSISLEYLQPLAHFCLRNTANDLIFVQTGGIFCNTVRNLFNVFFIPVEPSEQFLSEGSFLTEMCFSFFTSNISRGSLSTISLKNLHATRDEMNNILHFLWLHENSTVFCPVSNLKLTSKLIRSLLDALVQTVQITSTLIHDDEHSPVIHEPIEFINEKKLLDICAKAAQSFSGHLKDYGVIEKCFLNVFHLIRKVEDTVNSQEHWHVVAHELDLLINLFLAMAYLGVAYSVLLTPSFLDPIAMQAAQKDCHQAVVHRSRSLMKCWDQYLCRMVGPTFETINSHRSAVPPLLSQLCRRLTVQTNDANKCQFTGVRDNKKYSELHQVTCDIQETLCSPLQVFSMLEGNDTSKMMLAKINSWEKAMIGAIQKLMAEYSDLSDVVDPYSMALTLIVQGVKSMSVIKAHQQTFKVCQLDKVQHVLQYPMNVEFESRLSWLQSLISLLTSHGMDNSTEIDVALRQKLLNLVLSACKDYLKHSHRKNEQLRHSILKLLKYFWGLWKNAQQQAQIKAMEAESLYKIKEHEIQKFDDDNDDKLLKEQFPSYDYLFSDEAVVEQTSSVLSDSGQSESVALHDADIVSVCALHMLLHGRETLPQSDYSQSPAIQLYEVCSLLHSRLGLIPGLGTDFFLHGAHIRMFALRKSVVVKTDSSHINVYKEGSVAEAEKSLPVIEMILTRISELLQDWPENPILVQVASVCEKVLSMSVEEPLMKLLSGYECILSKAQEWEAYASTGVSLKSELDRLVEIVLEWRRIELSYYERLLESYKRELDSGVSRWWFHLYGLCQEAPDDDLDGFTITLQSFVEKSSLGEFCSRLLLVSTFRADMLVKGRYSVSDVLGNVHQYYSQFSAHVLSAMEKLTSVVVKDFKNQLQVMRWNDGSYWSVKSSIRSSHKKLLTLMKNYQEILTEPVLPVLTEVSLPTEGSLSTENKFSLVNLIDNAVEPKTIFVKSFDNIEGQILYKEEELIINADTALKRMSSIICKLRNSFSTDCVKRIDDFTGEIIVTVEDLASNHFLENVEEEKREATIKARQSLKRKMLSDLFKTLSTEGLSFKKGLDSSSNFTVKKIMQLPFEDCAEFPAAGFLWNKMNEYYERCIARLMVVQNAFTSPSKDLNLPQVQRCKGLTHDLLTLILSHRIQLMKALRDYKKLINAVAVVQSMCSGKTSASFCDYQDWTKCLCDMLELCLYLIQCVDYLSNTAPSELDATLTPLSLSSLNLNIQSRADLFVNDLKSVGGDIQEAYDDAVKRELYLSSCHVNVVSKGDIKALQNGFSYLKKFSDILSAIQAKASTIRSPIFFFLETYEKFFDSKWTLFTEWMSSVHESKFNQESSENHNVFKVILVTFQKLSSSIDHEEATLKSVTTKSIAGVEGLNITQVKSEVSNFLLAYSTESTKLSTGQMEILCSALNCYLQLCQDCLIRSISIQASVCKLSSILFNLFATLGSKGFCKPVQETDVNFSNKTDSIDIEAGGFADGTGEKNVSSETEKDNMEPGKSEDNLENSTKRAQEDEDAISVNDDILNDELKNISDKEEETDDNDDDDVEELGNTMGELDPEDSPDDLNKDMWAPESDNLEELAYQPDAKGGTENNEETSIVAKQDMVDEATSELTDPYDDSLQVETESDHTALPEELDNLEDDMDDLDSGDMDGIQHSISDGESSETENRKENEDMLSDGEDGGNSVEDSTILSIPTSSTFASSGQALDNEPAKDSSSTQENEANTLCVGNFSVSTSQSKDLPEVGAVKDSHQNDHGTRRRRAPTDQGRVLDDDLEATAKRARLVNQEDSVADVSNPEDTLLYRHTNEAESVIADSIVWDWSASRGGQSSYPNTEDVMEENTDCDLMECTEATDTTGCVSRNSQATFEKENKLEVINEHVSDDKQPKYPSSESFFSKLKKKYQSEQEHIAVIREDMVSAVTSIQSEDMDSIRTSITLWRQYSSFTHNLAQTLYEELSLILTPTSASQLRGDYRSGKRLNMRRIIPFIASNYQNDRIWLRRTKLVDRRYQVMVTVDDSSSMQENNCRQMAYESLAVIISAVTRLTNGQIGVCRFGLNSEMLHSMEQTFTDEDGGNLLHHLTFKQKGTSFKEMLRTVKSVFVQYAQQPSTLVLQSIVFSRLLIILSDGRGVFSDGGVVIDMALRRLTECGIFTVFIILDTQAQDSISDIKVPMFSSEKGPVIASYLEVFPFPFYIILRDLQKMPHVLGQALRQWLEMLTSSS